MFKVLNTIELDYSLIIKLENKNDSFVWYFTVVYGPNTAAKKTIFSRAITFT
jgi:uncharacterized protein YhaN